MSIVKVLMWLVLSFLIGFVSAWALKPQSLTIDKSWNFLPHYSYQVDSSQFSNVAEQVGALRPPSRHFSQDRFDCCDCDICHNFCRSSLVSRRCRTQRIAESSFLGVS